VLRWWTILTVAFSLLASGCTDSSGYSEPGPRPQIVAIAGPPSSAVVCDPEQTGGACPLSIRITFRLPPEHFVWKAYVRFQGDGGDTGVDRGYLIPLTFGAGEDQDATVTVDAAVPPALLGQNTLLRYGVRLVTGAGEESPMSTLTLSVQ
jgi:hypothetical protein